MSCFFHRSALESPKLSIFFFSKFIKDMISWIFYGAVLDMILARHGSIYRRQQWQVSLSYIFKVLFEPPHEKTNEMACAPSKDSDQVADAQADLSLCWAHSHFVGFVRGGSILIDNSNIRSLVLLKQKKTNYNQGFVL